MHHVERLEGSWDGSSYKKSTSSSAESLPAAGCCSSEHSPMNSTATYSSAPSTLGTRRPQTRRYVRSREPRLRWTQDLHQTFVRAIEQLGGHESEHGSMHLNYSTPFCALVCLAIWCSASSFCSRNTGECDPSLTCCSRYLMSVQSCSSTILWSSNNMLNRSSRRGEITSAYFSGFYYSDGMNHVLISLLDFGILYHLFFSVRGESCKMEDICSAFISWNS